MSANEIARLNDRYRRQGQGNGRTMITRGVQAEGQLFVAKVFVAVRSFDAFTVDNDPHGEHDFGALEVDGIRIFWKIDLYDPTLSFGTKDPTDERLTCRVLTIMRSEEY